MMNLAVVFYALVGTVFGYQFNYPRDGQWGTHTGVDFPWGSWTPIPMFASGRVVAKGYNSTHGYWVSVIVGSTYFHFCHLVAASELEAGALLQVGDTVGYVGATGDVTGAHLHLAASNEPYPGTGNRVDPLPLVRSYLTSSAGSAGVLIPTRRKATLTRRSQHMLAVTVNDNRGLLGKPGTRTYMVGEVFIDTTDHRKAVKDAMSVLANGFALRDDGTPFIAAAPDLSYAELADYAAAAPSLVAAEKKRYREAADAYARA